MQASLNVGGTTQSALGTLTINAASQLPTVQQVFDHLSTIPILNGNIIVKGRDGGPFGVIFTNDLVGFNSNPLTFLAPPNTGNPLTTSQTMANGSGSAVQ